MLHRDALINRFLKYVSFDTQSDEENDAVCPSTPGQLVFSKALAEELKGLGLSDVSIDEHGYVMATLPANGVDGPVVGFISHVDTSPDASGKDIKVVRKDNYDGKDIVLNEEKNIVFSTESFPEILKYKGQDILFTDGTTLLGADDKAGVTAIVSAVEYLIQHPDVKHGKIRIGFTPDEETGRSAALFDVEKFGAHFAYTVDGGELGGLEYENFNAANWTITFHGRSVHTGDAKGKMKNALTMAAEWQQLLPAGEKPEYTEGHEGFFHVYKLNGDVETCTMHILIRDHDRKLFEQRKAFLRQMAALFTDKYGQGTVDLDERDVYYNMLEKSKTVIWTSSTWLRRPWKPSALRRKSLPSAAVPTGLSSPSAACRAPISLRAVPTSTAVSNTCPLSLWSKPAKRSLKSPNGLIRYRNRRYHERNYARLVTGLSQGLCIR